jgi:hypothetical protein
MHKGTDTEVRKELVRTKLKKQIRDQNKRMLERSPCGKQIYRKIESTG